MYCNLLRQRLYGCRYGVWRAMLLRKRHHQWRKICNGPDRVQHCLWWQLGGTVWWWEPDEHLFHRCAPNPRAPWASNNGLARLVDIPKLYQVRIPIRPAVGICRINKTTVKFLVGYSDIKLLIPTTIRQQIVLRNAQISGLVLAVWSTARNAVCEMPVPRASITLPPTLLPLPHLYLFLLSREFVLYFALADTAGQTAATPWTSQMPAQPPTLIRTVTWLAAATQTICAAAEVGYPIILGLVPLCKYGLNRQAVLPANINS